MADHSNTNHTEGKNTDREKIVIEEKNEGENLVSELIIEPNEEIVITITIAKRSVFVNENKPLSKKVIECLDE